MKEKFDLITADFAFVRWLGNHKGIEEVTKTWAWASYRETLHGLVGREKVNCGSRFSYLQFHPMKEFPKCRTTIRSCAPIVKAISV